MMDERGTSSGVHIVYPTLKICTYNIISGRNSRIEQALRCVRSMTIDIAVLTESKLQNDHTINCEGYEIVATTAKSKWQGGVALCYRKSDVFHLEDTRIFGPNVIRTTIVSGRKKWRLVGVYIPPSEVNGETIQLIQAAASISPNLPLILVGDLNVDLKREILNDNQSDRIELVTALSLQNLSQHFRQRKGVADYTWSQKDWVEEFMGDATTFLQHSYKTSEISTLKTQDLTPTTKCW